MKNLLPSTSQESGDRVEALQQRLAEAEFAIQRERERTRLFSLAWHEAMRTVTHLNAALRRKNRQIVRLKELRVGPSPAPKETT